jgi:WD40 repeat protein
VTRFDVPFDYYGFLRFSRSGRYLMASILRTDWTASARVWHTNDWSEVLLRGSRFEGLWPVDLSPDDQLLAAGYLSGAVKLFRFPSLQDKATLPEHPGIVSGVLFSPNGRGLLSVGRYGSIRLWDVMAGRKKAEWRGDISMIWGSVLSPDGGRLATGGLGTGGDAIQLWDLAARRETFSLHGEKLDFVHLTFSPDGNTLAATGLSGIAHLWRAPSWAEIEAVEEAQRRGIPPP